MFDPPPPDTPHSERSVLCSLMVLAMASSCQHVIPADIDLSDTGRRISFKC